MFYKVSAVSVSKKVDKPKFTTTPKKKVAVEQAVSPNKRKPTTKPPTEGAEEN